MPNVREVEMIDKEQVKKLDTDIRQHLKQVAERTLSPQDITTLVAVLNGEDVKLEAQPFVYGRAIREQVYLCGKCKRELQYDFMYCPRCRYKIIW